MGINKYRIQTIKTVLRMLDSYNELSDCKPFLERLHKHGYKIEPIDDYYFIIRCNVQLHGKYAVNQTTVNLKNLSSYNDYQIKKKRDERINPIIGRTKNDVYGDKDLLLSFKYRDQFKDYFADGNLKKYNPWLSQIGISLKWYPDTQEQYEQQEKEIMHLDDLFRKMKDNFS